MKRFIFALALVALMGASTPVFAAMPNYVGTDYKQGKDCNVPPEHGIWQDVAGKTTLTGCITVSALDRARAYAQHLQSTGLHFAAGSSVTYKTGRVEFCPVFITYGCVADRDLIR